MRLARIIAIMLINVLLVLSACAKPTPVTPAPTATPVPSPTPAPATPAPNVTPEPSPLPTPPPVEPPPVTPPPVTPPPVTPPPVTPPAVIPVPGPNEVWIQSREFRPNIMTVPVGTTVTWKNKDFEEHTVTSDTLLFNGYLAPLDSFSYTFDEPGTFVYHCDPHPEMTGKVNVK